jgi:hypothetical protein
MRISMSGWRRDVLNHHVVDRDVADLEPSEDKTYFANEAYIEKSDTRFNAEPEGLEVAAVAEKLSLNGDYVVRVKLTKDEIANLARIAFRNDPFGDVVTAFSPRIVKAET